MYIETILIYENKGQTEIVCDPDFGSFKVSMRPKGRIIRPIKTETGYDPDFSSFIFILKKHRKIKKKSYQKTLYFIIEHHLWIQKPSCLFVLLCL